MKLRASAGRTAPVSNIRSHAQFHPAYVVPHRRREPQGQPAPERAVHPRCDLRRRVARVRPRHRRRRRAVRAGPDRTDDGPADDRRHAQYRRDHRRRAGTPRQLPRFHDGGCHVARAGCGARRTRGCHGDRLGADPVGQRARRRRHRADTGCGRADPSGARGWTLSRAGGHGPPVRGDHAVAGRRDRALARGLDPSRERSPGDRRHPLRRNEDARRQQRRRAVPACGFGNGAAGLASRAAAARPR